MHGIDREQVQEGEQWARGQRETCTGMMREMLREGGTEGKGLSPCPFLAPGRSCRALLGPLWHPGRWGCLYLAPDGDTRG